MKQFCTIFLMLFFLSGISFSSVPESKEAILIEVVSSSEVYMEGVGIYNSQEKSRRKRKKDVKKYGQQKAIDDAKKAAVYFLLFNGTDPLLADKDSIDRFLDIQDDFFAMETINELVVYTADQPDKIVVLNKGEGVKVYQKLKINHAYLRQLLEENLVIFSKQELVNELGFPQIIVIPVATDTQSPLDVLAASEQHQHAAGVIESYLTSKQYDVIIPSQLADINQLVESIGAVKGVKSDAVYQLALGIGSDIYLEYSIGKSKSAYDTDQMSVTLRAYETTTGRLLATETGYSKARVGELFLSIEEALLSALTNVTQRILNYWTEDLQRGVQYKVIATVSSSDISEDKLQDIQNDFLDSADEVSLQMKENVITETTFDVSLWCDNDEYSNARYLYKALVEVFEKKQRQLVLKQVNRNRKLLLLDIR